MKMMIWRIARIGSGVVFGLLLLSTPVRGQEMSPRPRLVVFLAVDQLRSDYFTRFDSDLTGGLARLHSDGVFYLNGEQDHAITETAPGHSTMLSGRSPASTNIMANTRGVEDAKSPLLAYAGPGASPHRFRGTTLFDWMMAADPGTRVLSVSMKDRGAILPIGRAKVPVYWYADGRFTTSRYYADSLPPWVRTYNARQGVFQAAGSEWDLLLPASSYTEPDSQPWLRGGRNTTFPHRLPTDTSALKVFYRLSPLLDSLTLDFALAGARELELGQRDGTDLLVISLSATDVIGHSFGPDSREIHDQIVRLDRYVGRFLDSLARFVPADRTVIVLTADHGVMSLPEVSALAGKPAGRVTLSGLARSAGAELEHRFQTPFGFTHDNGLLFANTEALVSRGVNVDSLAEALRQQALGFPGVDRVYTPRRLALSTELAAMRWKRTIAPDAEWLIAATVDPGYIWITIPGVAMHGTTNPDDVVVPIAFVGPGIGIRHPDRTVRTIDIAPTLAALLGIRPTEVVEGVPLREVLVPQP